MRSPDRASRAQHSFLAGKDRWRLMTAADGQSRREYHVFWTFDFGAWAPAQAQ